MPIDHVRSKKVLKGIDTIRHYIDPERPISPEKFRDFLKMGMPALQIGSVWYAHADNIDQWFQMLTNVKNPNVPDEVIDEAE
jgi:hypothetical protein